MSGVLIFFAVFFLVFLMQGPWQKGPEHYKPEILSKRRVKNWAQSQIDADSNSDQHQSGKKRATTSFARANQARIAARTGSEILDGMDSVRNRNDKNRHRRTDWGSRAGPGILSLKNTSILIVAGLLLLWVMSGVPA